MLLSWYVEWRPPLLEHIFNISEPVARCCSLKGARSSIFHLIHVEVGYNNYRNERTAGSIMFFNEKKSEFESKNIFLLSSLLLLNHCSSCESCLIVSNISESNRTWKIQLNILLKEVLELSKPLKCVFGQWDYQAEIILVYCLITPDLIPLTRVHVHLTFWEGSW